MTKIIIPLIFIVILTLVKCNTHKFNFFEARKSVLEQNTKRVNAIKDGDIDTLMEMYADDATLLPPNDTMKRGKGAISMFYLLQPRSGKVIDTSIASTEIKGGDITCYEIGAYYFLIRPFESDATQIDRGKYLTIWKHQSDGSWKVFTECWNSDIPSTNSIPVDML